MNCICQIEIDEKGLARPTPEIEQERRVAIYDLLEENSFTPAARPDREMPGRPLPRAAGDPRRAAGLRHRHRGRGKARPKFHLLRQLFLLQ